MLPGRPLFRLRRLAAPGAEPLPLAKAKGYLRVDHDADDDLIQDLIAAARLMVESMADRTTVTTAWEYTLDRAAWSGRHRGYLIPGIPFADLPCGGSPLAIRLPMPPIVSIGSVERVGIDGTATALDPDSYRLADGTPGYVSMPRGLDRTAPACESIRVAYTAGYGPDPADVPRNLVHALRMLLSHYYEHRSSDEPTPRAIADLVAATL